MWRIEGTKALNASLSVEAPADAKVFMRRAIKLGQGEAKPVTWLVVEHNDVKVYFMEDGRVVVSEEALYP